MNLRKIIRTSTHWRYQRGTPILYKQDDERLREELPTDIRRRYHSYQALWYVYHFSKADVEWLSDGNKKNWLTPLWPAQYSGKWRISWTLICWQPAADPPRVDFDCMERRYPAGNHRRNRSAWNPLINWQRSILELQIELRTILEIMEPDLLVPAIRSVRKTPWKPAKAKKTDYFIAFYPTVQYSMSRWNIWYTVTGNLNTDVESEKATSLLISIWFPNRSQPLWINLCPCERNT